MYSPPVEPDAVDPVQEWAGHRPSVLPGVPTEPQTCTSKVSSSLQFWLLHFSLFHEELPPVVTHGGGGGFGKCFLCFCFGFFFVSGVGAHLYPEFLHFYTMILQRIRIIMEDAGFEPGTSAPEVWCSTNEPPHL